MTRSSQEISKELESLDRILGTFDPETSKGYQFGKVIGVQRRALTEEGLTGDEVEDDYGDVTDGGVLYYAAMDALDWRLGESDTAPSLRWVYSLNLPTGSDAAAKRVRNSLG